MRELIPLIEEALGSDRLARLRRDEDAHQDFWVGVLEGLERVDWDRDAVAFLITAGYGAVRNAKRSKWTRDRYRICPSCGRVVGYRHVQCSHCGAETESGIRHSEYETSEARPEPDRDLVIDIQRFVATLSGPTAYVARRWMIDRLDLLSVNHTKQIAAELGVSAPRVAQIKKVIKSEFMSYLNR